MISKLQLHECISKKKKKWICRLKTLATYGFNTKFGDYAQEMFNFY